LDPYESQQVWERQPNDSINGKRQLSLTSSRQNHRRLTMSSNRIRKFIANPILKKSPTFAPGLPGPQKLKRPNLAISSFKKAPIFNTEKGPISLEIFFK